MAKKPKVIVIVGPTSSGKTALSLSLAKKFKGEVISADSRQVYKGFNLLAGTVTKKEMGKIPHHLIGIANPKKVFSVTDYQAKAGEALNKIIHKKKLPIIVGGSGFYLDSILYENIFPEVPPNKTLRKELEKLKVAELASRLEKLDPVRFAGIDLKNPVRLIRAIEIATTLGQVPPRTIKINPAFDFLIIYLKPDPIKLAKKIEARIKERLNQGLLKEAQKLIATKKIAKKRMRDLGLEFTWSINLLEGKVTKQEMIEGLLKDHLKYVKRQHTWFRKYPKTFTPKNITEAIKKVKQFLSLN